MKFKKYTYGNKPELLPLSESFGLVDDEKIISLAGFDPHDEEVTMCELADDWNGHPIGSLVITGITISGCPFTIFETLETQSGEYLIYHSINSKNPESHEQKGWYFQPTKVCELYQDTFSSVYDSMTNALQAAYQWEAENMAD